MSNDALYRIDFDLATHIESDEVRAGDVVMIVDHTREDMGPIIGEVVDDGDGLAVADTPIPSEDVRIERAWRPWPTLPEVQLSIVRVGNGQTYILMPKGWVRVEGGYVGAEMVARQVATFGGTAYLPGMGSPIKNGEWV